MRDADITVRVSATADPAAVRTARMGLLLRSLRDRGPRSRGRLAEETGLTRTVANGLVDELAELGLVSCEDADRRGAGRPGVQVRLIGSSVCGVGAEINVDHLAVVAVDLAGTVIAEARRGIDGRSLPPEGVLAELAGLVADALAEARTAGTTVTGVTVGVAGLVDTATQRVTLAPNLGWRDIDAAEDVRRRLGAAAGSVRPVPPVRVANEATLAATAELDPTDADRADMVVLYGEVGLGGAIVSGGRVAPGRHGWAGEIGHLPIDPRGRLCGCGRTGCWETVVGLRALLEAATDPDDPVRDPVLTLEERLATLVERARLADGRTLAALDEVGTWLGTGAAVLVNTLNPGTVVLSGYFAVLGEWLRPAVEARLAADVLAPRAGGTRVAISAFGPTAAVRGGALVSLEPVLSDPTTLADLPELHGGTR
ncbi:Sugar kinase of the NBD/HSP70 family, may contain an N-terminal HTH domain [Nocardioides sp. YR527]|uniref:ROK family transcriptional regulator n=1 Tax=Nocardioides sp. YR527 TaxID=1881028 RepID=UPI000880FEA2|nr:ROK family transcriptional regulator [Nocardioides sp. YR527]SDK85497.1 Sugar kinase of the NBD/HSP70 family, may contain an N-terminal HTH domain [Nocardioides sp. YR527]